jgi:hypothetical protein
MRRALLISLSLVLALVGWTTVCADDGFYVIPTVKGKYAPVPKTGQTASYFPYFDDGYYEKGVAWPTPRFNDNGNGTVTDKLTGLIWMQQASCLGQKTWDDALNAAATLANGTCGLTDGSEAGDWRLPNIRELQSLVDYGRLNPALPTDHPFIIGQTRSYWSSSTYGLSPDFALYVDFSGGTVPTISKGNNLVYVWCVRGGK